LRLILGDTNPDGRKVEYLAFLLTHDGLLAQVSATFRAFVEWHRHGDVGTRALEQRPSGMAGLAAGFAAGGRAAKGLGALQAIAGRRLAAVGTVLVEALFKLRDAGFKLRDDCLMAGFLLVEQGDNQPTHRIQPALIKGGLNGRSQGLLIVTHRRVNVRQMLNLS